MLATQRQSGKLLRRGNQQEGFTKDGSCRDASTSLVGAGVSSSRENSVERPQENVSEFEFDCEPEFLPLQKGKIEYGGTRSLGYLLSGLEQHQLVNLFFQLRGMPPPAVVLPPIYFKETGELLPGDVEQAIHNLAGVYSARKIRYERSMSGSP